MDKQTIIDELYELFTSEDIQRAPRRAELRVKGFDAQMYAELYEDCFDLLEPFFEPNFRTWYEAQIIRCRRWKMRSSRSGMVYLPQFDKPLEKHTAQERLYIFKFFVVRRKNSGFQI